MRLADETAFKERTRPCARGVRWTAKTNEELEALRFIQSICNYYGFGVGGYDGPVEHVKVDSDNTLYIGR